MIHYPKLSMIVARARNGVIGVDGDLPWKLSSDLKFFKKTTMGKPVLMGRVTWDSLPFPLPGRPNLVLTRNQTYKPDGAEVFHAFDQLVARGYELAGNLNVDEVVIIGGAGLYDLAMPFADRLYVTEVDADVTGDTVFPTIDPLDWTVVSETETIQGPKDDYPFRVKIYERKVTQAD